MLYRFGIDSSLRAIFRGILTSRIAQSLRIELANASARCSRPVAIWRAFDESASMRHGLVWVYGPTATLQRGFKCMPGGLAQPYAVIGRSTVVHRARMSGHSRICLRSRSLLCVRVGIRGLISALRYVSIAEPPKYMKDSFSVV